MAVDIEGMISENVILIDAEYADEVAFNLSVMFERMLERRIPKADLAHWLDCVALDGGISQGENDIQIVFIYKKGNESLRNFTPANYSKEINGKAFKDNIGEFTMEAYPVENDVTDTGNFYVDTLQVILNSKDVKNAILIPNMEQYGGMVKDTLRKNDQKKNTTLLSMEPQMGTGFNQQILGYSIMSALGIRSDEIR